MKKAVGKSALAFALILTFRSLASGSRATAASNRARALASQHRANHPLGECKVGHLHQVRIVQLTPKVFAAAGIIYFINGSKSVDGSSAVIESIAVLPFVNEASDSDAEYQGLAPAPGGFQ